MTTVSELSKQRDAIKADHKSKNAKVRREITDKIEALHKQLRRATDDGERAELHAEISRLQEAREGLLRPPALAPVMDALKAQRQAEREADCDKRVGPFETLSDEALALRINELQTERDELLLQLQAAGRVRSKRLRRAEYKAMLEKLSADERADMQDLLDELILNQSE